MINNFVQAYAGTLNFWIKKMFGFISLLTKQHKALALATERFCAGYWVIAGLNLSIEQDSMKLASFYKESR